MKLSKKPAMNIQRGLLSSTYYAAFTEFLFYHTVIVLIDISQQYRYSGQTLIEIGWAKSSNCLGRSSTDASFLRLSMVKRSLWPFNLPPAPTTRSNTHVLNCAPPPPCRPPLKSSILLSDKQYGC